MLWIQGKAGGGGEQISVTLVFLVIHLIFENSSNEILLFPWHE